MRRATLEIALWAAAVLLLLPAPSSASSLSDITRSCVGFERISDFGTPFSFIFDDVQVDNPAGGSFQLSGEAFGSVSDKQAPVSQFAGAGVSSEGVTLNPSDLCEMAAGNIITSEIFGRHVEDPQASGMVDALLRLEYSATFEYQSMGGGNWEAFSGVEVLEPGSTLDSFEVASGTVGGERGPEGFVFTDQSANGVSKYLATGMREIPIVFKYGPTARNQVQVTFFGGGQVNAFGEEFATTAAGFANFNGLGTLTTAIESLDPDVEFRFSAFPVPEPGTGLLALAALATLAQLRRSRIEPRP